MKALALLLVVVALLFSFAPVRAMETTTYQFSASIMKDVTFPFTTYRTGDITVTADFEPNSHGLYLLGVGEPARNFYCGQGYDFRRGKTNPMPMTCVISQAPAGDYSVTFRNAMGGKVDVTLTITAETNP